MASSVVLDRGSIDALTNAIISAMGRSGESINERRRITRDETLSTGKATMKKLYHEFDNFTDRLFRVGQDFTEHNKAINRVLSETFADVRQQSNIVRNLIDTLDDVATDTSTVSKRLPNSIRQSVESLFGDSESILKIVREKHVRSGEEYVNLIDEIRGKLTEEIKKIQGEKFSESGVSSPEFKKRLRALFETIKHESSEIGVSVDQLAESIGLSTEKINDELNIKLGKNLNKVSTDLARLRQALNVEKNIRSLNKATGTAVDRLLKFDLSATNFLKNRTFERMGETVGVTTSEIELLRKGGITPLNFAVIALAKTLWTVGTRLATEYTEIAKASFETGIKPTAAAARNLGMQTQELQRVMQGYNRVILSEGGNYEKFASDLQRKQADFKKIAGEDRALAAKLNIQTQEFIKMYAGGTANMDSAINQNIEHMKYMMVAAGQSAEATLAQVSTVLESTEMQEMLIRLGAREQQQMIRNIQRRQQEYYAMGLTAERAIELAAQLEKVRQMSVPERVKTAGRMAQLALRLGMDPQEVMRARQAMIAGTPIDEDFLKRFAERTRQEKQELQALGYAGLPGLHALEAQINNLGQQFGGILQEFMQMTERAAGIKIDPEKVRKSGEELSGAFANEIGHSLIQIQDKFRGLFTNLSAFIEDPIGSVKLLGSALLDVGNIAAKTAGKLTGQRFEGESSQYLGLAGTGALIGLGGYGLAKGAEYLGGKIKDIITKRATESSKITEKTGNLLGRIMQSGVGQGVAKIGSAALRLTPWGIAGSVAAGVGIPLLMKMFGDTSGTPASPSLPQYDVSRSLNKMLESQNVQNEQLIQLNQKMQAAITLLSTGNKNTESISSSARDLLMAYVDVEQKNMSNEALYRIQEIRRNMWNTGISPYIKK